MSLPRLPVACPDLGALEQQYAADAVASGWVSSIGPYLERFEGQFAASHDVAHAAACSNGTTALHLALLAAGVGPGDEVIVPALTFVATANAVLYCNATPVIVDVDDETLTLDPASTAEAITDRTRAVVPVHLYGHPADLDPLVELADRHGFAVVEDAAEAHGARYRGRPVGSIGDAGTFSFFGNKIITTGEGGMVTTPRPDVDDRVRLLRGQAVDPKRRYWFDEVGFNYRLTNVAAAIGCAEVERLPEILARRAAVDDAYRRLLAPLADRVQLPPSAPWADPVCWTFTIRLRPESARLTRDELAERLDADGIETRPIFPSIERFPHLRPFHSAGLLPVSSTASEVGLSLPTSSLLSDAELERVTDSVFHHLGGR